MPRRRDARMLKKTKQCSFFLQGICSRGDSCAFAHGEEEVREKPDFACTTLCSMMSAYGYCNDLECKFAHSMQELRPTARQQEELRKQASAHQPALVPGPVPVGHVPSGFSDEPPDYTDIWCESCERNEDVCSEPESWCSLDAHFNTPRQELDLDLDLDADGCDLCKPEEKDWGRQSTGSDFDKDPDIYTIVDEVSSARGTISPYSRLGVSDAEEEADEQDLEIPTKPEVIRCSPPVRRMQKSYSDNDLLVRSHGAAWFAAPSGLGLHVKNTFLHFPEDEA